MFNPPVHRKTACNQVWCTGTNFYLMSNKAKKSANGAKINLERGQIAKARVMKFIKASPNDHDSSVLLKIGGTTVLMHRTEMVGYPRFKAEQVLKANQEVEVEIIKVAENGQVRVSTKTLAFKRTIAQIEPGMVVEAEVLRATNYGYFVHIGGGVEGLLHNNDLCDDEDDLDAEYPQKESLEIGSNVQVVILSFAPDGSRLALGRWQIFASTENRF